MANRNRKDLTLNSTSKLVEVEVDVTPTKEILPDDIQRVINNNIEITNNVTEDEEPDKQTERCDWAEESDEIVLPSNQNELQNVGNLINREEFEIPIIVREPTLMYAWLLGEDDADLRVNLFKNLVADEYSLLMFVNEVVLPWLLDDNNIPQAVEVLGQTVNLFTDQAIAALFLPIFKKKRSLLCDINCGYYQIISKLRSCQQNSLLVLYFNKVKLGEIRINATVILNFIDQCYLPYSTIQTILEYFLENHSLLSSRPYGVVLVTIAGNFNDQTPNSLLKLLKNITHHLRPILRHQIRSLVNNIK